MNTITVFFKGNKMAVYQAVAHQLKLRNGQNINSESEMWAILSANCSHGISLAEHKMQSTNN